MRAVFLDRDGVLNEDRGYVHRIEDFVFLPAVFEGCRRLIGLGYSLLIATNQSGIARGLYTEADFQALTDWMLARLQTEGIAVRAVFHCPYHPDFSPPEQAALAAWRKPAPGMFLHAARALVVELPQSISIGDKETDIEAGRAAGIGGNILIATGKPATAPASNADAIVPNLVAAADWIARRRP
jgi:D-glycero-D-manno-heptose 1,7-bisphosphate phosphatase